jgi:prepilin-type N-terminal cleavage/methylation domain-containing protein
MTLTCTARMRRCRSRTRPACSAFTLTELIVVIVILAFSLLLAMINLFGLFGRSTFRAQVQDFVSAMRMGATAAAESYRRYEVIIDLSEQSYLLREITSPDLTVVLEEEIIVDNYFDENCRVAYVLFDDVDYSAEGESYTNDVVAKFRAGHSGWQYGGKIVFLDNDDQEYSVVVNRLNRMVKVEEGDVEILKPKAKDDLPF